MSDKKRKVPKLRFPGFTDEWEQRKLGELAEIVRGASPRPIQNPKWFDNENSEIGWLRISDVTEQNGRIKFLKQRISKEGQEKTRVLKEPHLLLSIAATVGKPVINYVKTGVHDGFLIFMNPEFDKEFMFQWLEMFRSKWQQFGQPGSQVNLNSEIVKNVDIQLPSCTEQQEIGNYFSSLDNLITLHQRKSENLQKLKKGLLQKMLPNNKECVPEIRFPGFTDTWEQRKANYLFETTVDKGHPELPVLSATQDRGMIRRDENSVNIYHDKKNEDGYKRVKPGQFVIHLRSFQGGFAHSVIEGITSPAYTVFGFSKPEDHDDNFWKYIFTSKAFIRRLETITYGIRDGRSISYDEFLTMEFIYPSKEEQSAMAQYFHSLDNLITLHQRKREHLEDLKKGLLQQMFI